MPFLPTTYRLDKPMPAFLFLMRHLGVRQGQAQRLVSKGRVLVEGVILRDSGAMICGTIEVLDFYPVSRGLGPIALGKGWLAFDKPSGMLVHPTTRHTPYALLDEIRHFGGMKANAVHRIDRETSGVVLAATTKGAEQYLKGLFEHRRIEKTYHAWVRGRINAPFVVQEPIIRRRDFGTCKHKVAIDPRGKPSMTSFAPLRYDAIRDTTLLACRPHTGRTHQIRIHLFHVKHPILGDPLYGTDFAFASRYLDGTIDRTERLAVTGAPRLMLHAQQLRFPYYDEIITVDSKMTLALFAHFDDKPADADNGNNNNNPQ